MNYFLLVVVFLLPLATNSEAPFGYEPSSPIGPSQWGNQYPLCASAVSMQSPIDFELVPADETAPIPSFVTLNDGCKTWVQSGNSDDFDITFAGICQNHYIAYQDKKWYLQTMRFISPSGHTMGGGHFDAEVVMLHQDPVSTRLLVVSVFLTATGSATGMKANNNTFLSKIWNAGGWNPISLANTVTVSSASNVVLRPYLEFMPGSQSFFQYVGSLQEPPCTQEVTYLVFRTPMMMSINDLKLIRSIPTKVTPSYLSLAGDNNRPVQPLNGRAVKYCKKVGTNAAASANSPTATNSAYTGPPQSVTDAQTGTTLGALAFVIASLTLVISLRNWAAIYNASKGTNGSDISNAPSLSLMLGKRGKAGGGSDDIEASKSLSGSEERPANVTNPLH